MFYIAGENPAFFSTSFGNDLDDLPLAFNFPICRPYTCHGNPPWLPFKTNQTSSNWFERADSVVWQILGSAVDPLAACQRRIARATTLYQWPPTYALARATTFGRLDSSRALPILIFFAILNSQHFFATT